MTHDSNDIVFIGWAREDRAHDRLVQTLARRVVIEGATWPIADVLEHMWRWAGPNGEAEFKITGDIEVSGSGGRRLRLHGRVAGQVLAPEARMYRKLLHAFDQASPRPSLVILARDGDGRSEERRRGFEQIVDRLSWPFTTILAMPEPESEAWYVCAFDPSSANEHAAHAAIKHELSFDPLTAPQRLTSRPNDARTDAKRVLAALCSDSLRQQQCIDEAELERLAQRGAHSGLASLIADLRHHLLPLLDPATRTNASTL